MSVELHQIHYNKDAYIHVRVGACTNLTGVELHAIVYNCILKFLTL